MRINRLDLTRYGKFTDRHLDFGSAEVGRPDLHVIYGPNEAGKSTALSAFLDLLFGIETRSRYGFLHPYSTMRVGAALDLGGVPTELVRIKKPQNSLLGPGDLPVSEGLLAGELGGVGRDAYCSMFSLDDDTLEKGGESILASRGDLGQLLFSATSGLASLGESLIQLRVRADGIFKLRSRSSEIGELKNRLSELKERRDQIDTLASHYGQMVETRDRAKASYDHAMAERAQTHLRLDEIRKVLTVLPRLAELRGLRLDLAGLPDVPEVPASWAEDVPILLAQELQLGAKIESARNAMLEVEQALDSITVDDVATGMGPRMEGLVEAHARYLTAERDLPERRLQMKQLEREIEEILRLLGRPEEEPGRVLLNAETTGMLRDLLERRSGIVATLENAKREADAAMRRLVRAREKISLDPAAAADAAAMAGLVREVSILREDDHAATRRVAERTRLELEEELAEQLLELRPWAGSTAELKQLVVPTWSEDGTLVTMTVIGV